MRPLTQTQLELLRHCFRYNDTSTHYLDKLSVSAIQDLVQCGHAVVSKKRKLWEKTGDVEKLYKASGRPRSLDDILEQALVQIFLDHVDITMEEALDWLEEEFKQSVCRKTLSTMLKRNNVSHKRLKFVAV
jgi:transposase